MYAERRPSPVEIRPMLRTVPPAARWLGLSGLIPFMALAALSLMAPGPWDAVARGALAFYGAVILSFMGGCRWGLAAAGMGEGPALRPLALSVAPSLWAWIALMAPAPVDLGMLALGLLALCAADVALTRAGGAPAWWPALRWPLTLGASVSLALAMAA
ncbi:MAG: DUF3429 domain-containing protein [Rhodobacterales bacterium CG18_big_fil_WC_8_21_14_2_50_71_9]|nr:MAG: DUF3429 domain-containing protein [Rhodobacterales bacterium CG18_big_fil_WC_8_21_14_2_50_71_9]